MTQGSVCAAGGAQELGRVFVGLPLPVTLGQCSTNLIVYLVRLEGRQNRLLTPPLRCCLGIAISYKFQWMLMLLVWSPPLEARL